MHTSILAVTDVKQDIQSDAVRVHYKYRQKGMCQNEPDINAAIHEH